MPSTATPPWRNRITRTGDADPATLTPHPRNWRLHADAQRQALAGVLDDVGVVAPVLVNERNGYLLDGHLRRELALAAKVPSVAVTYVDLDEREELVVLATLDPLSAMADPDPEQLRGLLDAVQTSNDAVLAMLADLADQNELTALPEPDDASGKYTTKVETPLYEPTGERPAVTDLIDLERHDTLLNAIDASIALSADTKMFLRLAATRHIVFDYRRIAEFYAHADADTQRLMEDSALVIIDVNRAIELGYATFRETMLDIVEDARGA